MLGAPSSRDHNCCGLAWLARRLPAAAHHRRQPIVTFFSEKDKQESSSTTATTTTTAASQDAVVEGSPSSSAETVATKSEPPAPRIHLNHNSSSSTEKETTNTITRMDQVQQPQRQQGVLWKRRDVFRNRWRPRWFVVHPSQGVLTYYLLTAPDAAGGAMTPGSVATPLPHAAARRRSSASASASSYPYQDHSNNSSHHHFSAATFPQTESAPPPLPGARARTASWDSAVSEQSVDYDVVPRGTIDLLGCTVQPNDDLSQPHENFFAFTISSPAGTPDVDVHLAARSRQARQVWMDSLSRVANPGQYWGSSRRSSSSNSGAAAAMPRSMPPRLGGSRVPPAVLEETTPHYMNGTRTLQTYHATETPLLQHSVSDSAVVEAAGMTTAAPASTTTNRSSSGGGGGWRTLDPAAAYQNLPPDLAQRIQQQLDTYLKLCDRDPERPESGWKRLFHRTIQNQPHRAYQRRGVGAGAGRQQQQQQHILLCSTARLNQSPLQVFNLIVDSARRQAYETNVRQAERLKILNTHTFLDYYAYNAVWPSSAREFAVALHWQVVGREENGGDRAVVCISFSSPHADALKAVEPNHVRATLHVSMYLLRPISQPQEQQCGCHLTRLLSFDLAGGMSPKLSNVVLTQQANLPAVVAEFLSRHEPVAENRFLLATTGQDDNEPLLTNERVVESVISHLGLSKAGLRRRLTFTEPSESFVATAADADSKNTTTTGGEHQDPGLETQTVLLLGPLILYGSLKYYLDGSVMMTMMTMTMTPSSSSSWVALAVFCFTAFWAVRQVVLLHVGEIIPQNDAHNDPPLLLGPVTCRFAVDLKGILRFIANKKEEQDELRMNGNGPNTTNIGQHQQHEEVTIVALVTSAVAKAWAAEKELRIQRAYYPLLWIDELIDISSTPVNVSVSENAGGVVTLAGVDRRSVQSVADELGRAEHLHDCSTGGLGDCLILATPDCDESIMETDALAAAATTSSRSGGSGMAVPSVVAVIGGVRQVVDERSSSRNHHHHHHHNSHHSTRQQRRPMLSVSLTMSIPHLTDVVGCRRYAEEVQKLLQFPEMCDG